MQALIHLLLTVFFCVSREVWSSKNPRLRKRHLGLGTVLKIKFRKKVWKSSFLHMNFANIKVADCYLPPLLHLEWVTSLENKIFFWKNALTIKCSTYFVDSSHAALSEHSSANIINIYIFLYKSEKYTFWSKHLKFLKHVKLEFELPKTTAVI